MRTPRQELAACKECLPFVDSNRALSKSDNNENQLLMTWTLFKSYRSLCDTSVDKVCQLM